jgi:ABC-type transport system involved in multi-copper enzyme maturation permease subunit
VITAGSPLAPAVVPAPRATGGWLVTTARLIRWELFQLWRRALTKVLLGLFLGFFALIVVGILLAYSATVASSAASPAGQCSSSAGPGRPTTVVPCSTSGPDERGSIDAARNSAAAIIRAQITFPLSVSLAVEYASFMGVIFLCIVAGSLVGSEYGFSTQRLALSRGVARDQALAAKVAALALLAAGTVGAMLLLGALVGLTVGPALGGTPDGLSADGVFQLGAYWGVTSLRLFSYSLIALFLATLGRSSAAGIGGALGFVVVEVVALPILTLIIISQHFVGAQAGVSVGQPIPQPSPVADTLTVTRDLFLQTNVDVLKTAARQGPLNLGGGASSISRIQDMLVTPPSTTQALVVVLLWCVALVGLSALLVRSRDVVS